MSQILRLGDSISIGGQEWTIEEITKEGVCMSRRHKTVTVPLHEVELNLDWEELRRAFDSRGRNASR